MAKKASPDAIALLKADHAEVKKAFKTFEKMKSKDGPQAQALIAKVLAALKLHAALEEEVFYPAVREAIDDDALMNEAEVEHASAKDLIAQIEKMRADDPMREAKFTVLGEYINHHVKEEEGEMFPEARKAKVDLKGLGAEMATRKARG